ncbi:MAG TPA: hypothetical protein PKA28_06500 [Methylomusa anaerophila]|uniref:Uncharacterized protein n=1 Tax=Methylomusa anaerophila TaxID=1930071 RepID=A0A348AGJ1_9FIRM|nr:hypothetical protein [Methylomusa anaerophila]BBB90189.1 hypothetical protein MAMMFC1_00837 [Methylomusa anaerophila]HML88085.1 hypothetical protein [Methylomusa anaerophila]
MNINCIRNYQAPNFISESNVAFRKATNFKKDSNEVVFNSSSSAQSSGISSAYTLDLSSSQTTQIDKKYLASQFEGKSKPTTSFVEDYAVTYQKLRKEIMDNSSSTDIEENLKVLDDVYKEQVAKAAETVAGTFENFFDYTPNTLKTLNKDMTTNAPVFNSSSFKEHLVDLAMQALEVVKNNPELSDKDLRSKINSSLKSIPADNTLENMSYKDLRIVSDIIKDLSSMSLSPFPGTPISSDSPYKYTDPDKAGNIMAKWNALLENTDKLAGLSEGVREKVTAAIRNNIEGYHKGAAYSNAMHNYDATIKELQGQLKDLTALRKKLEGIVKQFKDQGMIDTASVFLTQLTAIEGQISGINGQIRSAQDAKTNLEKNPDSIVDTEEYKQIKDAYKSQKDKLKST